MENDNIKNVRALEVVIKTFFEVVLAHYSLENDEMNYLFNSYSNSISTFGEDLIFFIFSPSTNTEQGEAKVYHSSLQKMPSFVSRFQGLGHN